MLLKLEATRSLFYHAVSEAKLPPTPETRQRARAAHVTVQRNAVEITSLAMRVCGGRAILKRFPLERHLRDARAASVMRPWTLGHRDGRAMERGPGAGGGARRSIQGRIGGTLLASLTPADADRR